MEKHNTHYCNPPTDLLNKFGQEGWDVYHIHDNSKWYSNVLIYMKREIPSVESR